ncbi:MAG TPA: PSD1 and planctomycete cytochrome C domain-containing protein [Caulifigura sp.]|nr:PSD1 and planctomycete cytochrome C domain-containing protein [Caulifigura sp.]
MVALRAFACRVLAVFIGVISAPLALRAAEASGPQSFKEAVWPILRDHCVRCHGSRTQEGSLRVDSLAELLEGGDSGPALKLSNSSGSRLIERVSTTDAADRMPPEGAALSAEQIETLQRWIQDGAAWPSDFVVAPAREPHWAFQPRIRPTPPAVEGAANPVDAFVQSRLKQKKLAMSPPADPRKLIRRLTLDLHGLPPSTEEVDRFVHEYSAAGAGNVAGQTFVVEELVDRLLASPRYGERWAQHWLDTIRYADTQGYERNGIRPSAWPYRDYVIAALNDDRSYREFVREQLAGDVLGVDEATGFLVTPPFPTDQEIGQEPAAVAQARFNGLDAVAQNIGNSILGVSIGCARCHDHKFDPIKARDYYRLIANFSGLQFRERVWNHGKLPVERRRRIEQDLGEIRQRLRQHPAYREIEPDRATDFFPAANARWIRLTILRTRMDKVGAAIEEVEVLDAADGANIALSSLGATVRSSGFKMVAGSVDASLNDGRQGDDSRWISDSRSGAGSWIEIELPRPRQIAAVSWRSESNGLDPLNVSLAWRVPDQWKVEIAEEPGAWRTVTPEELGESSDSRKLAEADFRSQAELLRDVNQVFAGAFSTPLPMHILKRGDPMQPLEQAPPGGIDLLGHHELAADTPAAARRLALADWLVDDRNPLTARVLVNRIWQHHFGIGIVDTPGDFGVQGGRPTHPELLDWLASELVDSGWRLKPIHRLICSSLAYRQSSEPQPEALRIDTTSRLLWRYPPRRLDGEAIRDSILFASGSLSHEMGGPGINLFDEKLKETSGEWRPLARQGPETWRRTIYLMKMRGADDGVFKAFDIPDRGQVCARRGDSTSPLQALNLFNSDFVISQAREMAQSIKRQFGSEPGPQLTEAFRRTLSRPPSEEERIAAASFLRRFELAALCRALLNSNEFLFIE